MKESLEKTDNSRFREVAREVEEEIINPEVATEVVEVTINPEEIINLEVITNQEKAMRVREVPTAAAEVEAVTKIEKTEVLKMIKVRALVVMLSSETSLKRRDPTTEISSMKKRVKINNQI